MSSSREALTAHVSKDAGTPLTGALVYEDVPVGIWAIIYAILGPLLRVRVLFFSFDGLRRLVFGQTEGYLGLTTSGTLVRIVTPEKGAAEVVALTMKGASLKERGGAYLLKAPNFRCAMRFTAGPFLDAKGEYIRSPELLAEGQRMVTELVAAVRAQITT
ncbi:MAG: hypothetical protein IPL40_01210 [Proteobacteria bacterium]|nr:hypothetical protein [Pseudomonadota bacterium]